MAMIVNQDPNRGQNTTIACPTTDPVTSTKVLDIPTVARIAMLAKHTLAVP